MDPNRDCEYCGNRLAARNFVINGAGRFFHSEPDCMSMWLQEQGDTNDLDYDDVIKGGL